MRYWLMLLLVAGTTMAAAVDGLPAVVQKDSVTVYSKPAFTAPTVATLGRRDKVEIATQQGLWYEVALHSGARGYLRVNEVRIADASATHTQDTMRILLTGKSGTGRVTETAGVRGLDESDLRSAAFDGAQLAQMEDLRVSAQAAAHYAAQHGWSATRIPWRSEAPPSHGDVAQTDARKGVSVARGLLSSFGHSRLGSMLGAGANAIPKSDAEITAEETALGPLIAGRVLGARPLWANAKAQHRVNVVGRWLASQTSQPNLPWTFGIIDSAEYNAFAAPGGYIMVTRGLYQLCSNDQELAAVLGHEITHVMQRDHYEVIRKQGLMSTAENMVSEQIHTGRPRRQPGPRVCGKEWCEHSAHKTGPQCRIPCRRERTAVSGSRRDEPAGPVFDPAEDVGHGQRVGQTGVTVRNPSATGCSS